jgi:lipopolysaccharide transport system permease protein
MVTNLKGKIVSMISKSNLSDSAPVQQATLEAVGNSPLSTSTSTVIIESSRGWSSLGLRDLWEYRELVYFMIWREIQGTYRQTALGLSWLLLRPLINMVVLTLVFGVVIKVPSDGVPYPLFSLAALLPWGYFSNAVTRAAGSLVTNIHVISKVYFPRMVIPLAGTISGLVDFGISFIVFFGVLLFYQMPLRVEMLWLPVFVLVGLVFALALGLWLATLSVKYRDVSFAINFVLQALMYASPVIYPVSLVPERMRFIYQLNPMTGVIQGFRWALLGSEAAPGTEFFISVVLLFLALIGGAFVFRRTERTIVDVL